MMFLQQSSDFPKEEPRPQHSARIMPVSRFPMASLQNNPLEVPRCDVENPLHNPVVATKQECEREHLDPGVDAREQMSILTFLKIVTLLSAIYVSASTWLFFFDQDKREICPYTVICATNAVELTLLTFSRLSAGALWASITISILTKCYATRSFLHHSWFGAVLEIEPTHDVHTYFGYLTLCAGIEHGILHCIRFIYSHEAWLIYETDVGRSGMVVCMLLLPIVLPMKFDCFRTKMTFQKRKNMHMLFLAMLVALCFHSVTFRYVGSILIVWYILDRLYFTSRQTFLIAHPVFEAVGCGTMVGLNLPAGYTFKAGSYMYVNSPTISRSEWHPFSIIQVPGKPLRAAFYAEAVGDWTQELFRLGLEQPRLPLWITAAQPSPMERSIYYDNIILVCTGAGITPGVSIIERFAKRKNIHLMWMSRDSGMIALFEKQLRKVNSTVHLTGEQTPEIERALERLLGPPREEDIDASLRRSVVSTKTLVNRFPSTRRSDLDYSGSGISPSSKSAYYPSFDSRTEWDRPVLCTPPRPKSLYPRGLSDEYSRQGHHHSFDLDRGTNAETAHDSVGGVEVLGSLPEGKLNKGEPRQRSETSPSRPDRHRSDSRRSGVSSTHLGVSPPSDPVTLNIGRPDIGKYLIETFANKTRDDEDATASHLTSILASQSATTIVGAGHSEGKTRESSSRLDNSQKTSKDMLLKADAKVVEACRKSSKQQTAQVHGIVQRLVSSAEPGDADTVSSSVLPWIVLYCGSNLQVEEAIAKVCDSLGVKWKKDYFGAW